MKTQPHITLLHNSPLHVANIAIRTCWGSEDSSDTLPEVFCKHCKTNMIAVDYDKETQAATCVTCGSNVEHFEECGEKDRKLIHRVGNQYKHSSTLEHLSYNFKIEDVSRALLQELARHRISSFSVRSSRYTLKELKGEDDFFLGAPTSVGYAEQMLRARTYVKLTGEPSVDEASVAALERLRSIISSGIPADKAKYSMPESYLTSLTWSVNARSLQNFLKLRSAPAALWEIRELANAIFYILPETHKFLFDEFMFIPKNEVKEK